MQTAMSRLAIATLIFLAVIGSACAEAKAPSSSGSQEPVEPDAAPASQPTAPASQPTALLGDTAIKFMAAEAPRVFVFSPESRIEFVGSKPGTDHDGGFTGFDGRITLIDSDPQRSRVDLVIRIDSLWTDSKTLTDHLLGGEKGEEFLQAAKYPTAEFHSGAIVGVVKSSSSEAI